MESLDKLFEELFEKLKSEVTRLLGYKVYSRHLIDSRQTDGINKRAWGLYSRPDCHHGNLGWVNCMKRNDKWFPNCQFPHLRVSIKKEWAEHANVTIDKENPKGDRDGPEALWCIPTGDSAKIKKVAEYLVKSYRAR